MFVIGFEDTRKEFEPKFITKTRILAEKAKEILKRDLFKNSRVWVSIKEIPVFDKSNYILINNK